MHSHISLPIQTNSFKSDTSNDKIFLPNDLAQQQTESSVQSEIKCTE